MRRCRDSLGWLVVISVLGLSAPAPTWAASCPGVSAGDQQYVDPLACANGGGSAGSQPSSSSHSGSRTTSAPSSTSTSPPAPSSTAPPATSAAAPSTASASAAADTSSSRSSRHGKLAFTGLDTWLIGLLGVGLIGGGIVLRRATVYTR